MISEKADKMTDLLVGACAAYGRTNSQKMHELLLEAVTQLHTYIAELEAECRWIPASERLPEVNGWYLCGMVSFLGVTFTNEIYFDAVNIDPRWNNPTQDRVYCWLDGVPELPELPEVQ